MINQERTIVIADQKYSPDCFVHDNLPPEECGKFHDPVFEEALLMSGLERADEIRKNIDSYQEEIRLLEEKIEMLKDAVRSAEHEFSVIADHCNFDRLFEPLPEEIYDPSLDTLLDLTHNGFIDEPVE